MSHIIGYVDGYDDGVLAGWAAREGDSTPLTVEVVSGGVTLGTAGARLFREDLKAAGIGDGRHGFEFPVPDEVRRPGNRLEVREVETGTALGGSPFAIPDGSERPLSGGARVRRFLADHYCTGEGLEIGALHRPMPLPANARVRYIDSRPTDELVRLWTPEVDGHQVVHVDVVADATTLDGITDAGVDFVIASHVLEHLEDPLRALFNLLRVVRSGGHVMLALPDRRRTFDAQRRPTPLDHVVRDFCARPDWSRHGHYEEWVKVVEGLAGENAQARIAKLESDRYPIHFHVWAPFEFDAVLSEARLISPVSFDVDLYKANGAEGIWVLRRL